MLKAPSPASCFKEVPLLTAVTQSMVIGRKRFVSGNKCTRLFGELSQFYVCLLGEQNDFQYRQQIICGPSLRKIAILPLLGSLNARPPAHAILREYLQLRLQLSLMQLVVVHGADPSNAHAWKSARSAVEEGTTGGAKEVGHRVARSNCLILAVLGELLLTFEVFERAVLDDEVGSEHGGGDLATVGA
ncbi:hypothetical protein LTR17_020093 [Elasticomyces elasticus]|nr:hypothetical protein LTR17_020093 [Elasticomyces elasticus]